MDPVTPNKGKGRLGGEEPTDVARIGDDTRMVVGTYEIAPGTTLGEYQIEAYLGGGGMGEVFTAVHPKIGKRAAVKVLKKELSSSFNVERFVDEARVVNAIGHPNIVDIFAFGEMPDGRCYYVMELLVGETLRERIARGPIPNDEVCAILKPLTRALDAAHAKGVIHRDLKPDNVFLVSVQGEKSIVKLLDFGIAKLAKADHRVEQTKSGVMVGTPQYIAPEQAKGHTIDHKADIYALGGIAFEMLTGRPPFVADNAMEMVAKHLMEQAPKPSSVNPEVSPELDSLVTAMLAKEPNKRPALADIALVIDRIKLGPINMEDARTLSYAPDRTPTASPILPRMASPQPRMATEDPPTRVQTPIPMRPETLYPDPQPYSAVVPVLTPSESYASEPRSGAHTAVEVAVTELTDKEAVTIKRPRGMLIGVSIVVLGVAAILSFGIVKLLAGESEKRDPKVLAVDAAVVAQVDAQPVVTPIPTEDAAGPAVAVDAAPAVIVDAAPERVQDAGLTVVPDAAVVTPPDAGRPNPNPNPNPNPQRPKTNKLVIVVANPSSDTVILINGRSMGHKRAEITLAIGSIATVVITGTGRKTQSHRIPVTGSAPLARTFELKDDLMPPGQR